MATGDIYGQAIEYKDGFAISNTGASTTGYIYTRETTTSIFRIRDVENGNRSARTSLALPIVA